MATSSLLPLPERGRAPSATGCCCGAMAGQSGRPGAGEEGTLPGGAHAGAVDMSDAWRVGCCGEPKPGGAGATGCARLQDGRHGDNNGLGGLKGAPGITRIVHRMAKTSHRPRPLPSCNKTTRTLP
jgi:hypothetical protein